jgi:hypothetical protein
MTLSLVRRSRAAIDRTGTHNTECFRQIPRGMQRHMRGDRDTQGRVAALIERKRP